ncbi:type III polyketide synthase [Algivirga pacifica]|uniref:Type III polyketide synthase n=1 Tax=Algivirga pacifica TaxID=1162670 RepID=A0ABP9DF51_9BACT
MNYLLSIGTAVPPFKHKQSDILSFMKASLPPHKEKEKRLLDIIYRKSAIAQRHAILPDFTPAFEKSLLFGPEQEEAPSLEKRMEVYYKHAADLAAKAAYRCLGDFDKKEVTHLITVSCTGLSAPGLEIALIEELGLPTTTFRTGINFMGCYAMFHALRQADAICARDPEAVVLIAGVELCTLHLQQDDSEDNLMANAIFADGAAAALVSHNKKGFQQPLKMNEFHSQLLLKGKQDMAWHLSSKGFLMRLSSYVPQLIKEDIAHWIHGIIDQAFPYQTKEEIHWAFHPGGPRILQNIGTALELPKEALGHSYETLKSHGNMSSVTILFVLKRLMDHPKNKSFPIFAAGFGPGLTMEGLTLVYSEQ